MIQNILYGGFSRKIIVGLIFHLTLRWDCDVNYISYLYCRFAQWIAVF